MGSGAANDLLSVCLSLVLFALAKENWPGSLFNSAIVINSSMVYSLLPCTDRHAEINYLHS